MAWLGPLLENADAIGSFTLLLLFVFGLIAGLVTGNVEIGSAVKERKQALKESNDALKQANEELRKIEADYTRVQVERELLWKSYTPAMQRRMPRKAVTK